MVQEFMYCNLFTKKHQKKSFAKKTLFFLTAIYCKTKLIRYTRILFSCCYNQQPE